MFVDNEARRFQTLIKETERRFGGREEPVSIIYDDFTALFWWCLAG